jgi:hypothetical protein
VPHLPILAVVEHCPDSDCRAAIGEPHTRDCTTVLCLTDGVQRTLHLTDPPDGAHDCGQAVWTGYPNGAIEAVAQGWFVRPGNAGEHGARWVPCQPGDPAAVPDLHAVLTAGRWHSGRQIFVLPELTHAG